MTTTIAMYALQTPFEDVILSQLSDGSIVAGEGGFGTPVDHDLTASDTIVSMYALAPTSEIVYQLSDGSVVVTE